MLEGKYRRHAYLALIWISLKAILPCIFRTADAKRLEKGRLRPSQVLHHQLVRAPLESNESKDVAIVGGELEVVTPEKVDPSTSADRTIDEVIMHPLVGEFPHSTKRPANHGDKQYSRRTLVNQSAALREFSKILPHPYPVYEATMRVNSTWLDVGLFYLIALGEGIGMRIQSGPGVLKKLSLYIDEVQIVQEIAFVVIAILTYLGVLIISAVVAYRSASNDSDVTFYSDPRYDHLDMVGSDVDDFTETFFRSPRFDALIVTGVIMVDFGRTRRQHVAFSFALDLSCWIVRDVDAMSADDRAKVAQFLDLRRNPLEGLEISKRISWKGWEELALNIKHVIKQKGFPGDIIVQRRPLSKLPIYKNVQWANFMFSYHFKTIVALSIVGWMFYLPYMWLRSARRSVDVHYHVDVNIDEFWSMIETHLTERGFVSSDVRW
eukprot:TRINITY_DN17569_c0_g1_i1.p1 TRINITY_DN17569_c0_g1~~TRINITY_DN17569_c0_g1_i1.p1  ORF type:complete len:436 (+),score=40.60 TRINITY_DN17569_c0_g1_i1:42-1349(+)